MFILSCTDNMLLEEVVGGVGFSKSCYGYSIRGSNDYCCPGLTRHLLVFTSARHMLPGYGLSHVLVC